MPGANQLCLTTPREEPRSSGTQVAWSHLLPPLFSLLPSTYPSGSTLPAFIWLHLPKRKVLRDAESEVKGRAGGKAIVAVITLQDLLHSKEIIWYLAFPTALASEALGQSLICSLANSEVLSCGKQVHKLSCFYQR